MGKQGVEEKIAFKKVLQNAWPECSRVKTARSVMKTIAAQENPECVWSVFQNKKGSFPGQSVAAKGGEKIGKHSSYGKRRSVRNYFSRKAGGSHGSN